MTPDTAKPIPVAIVAACLWIATVIALVVGVALLFPGTFLDRMWAYNRPAQAALQTLGKSSGVGFLVLGLVVGATAGGGLSGGTPMGVVANNPYFRAQWDR